MGNILQSLGLGGAQAAGQAPLMGAEWNPGFGMFGVDPGDISKYLPPTAGINQIGGPMSGIGMLKSLLGGGGEQQQQQQQAPSLPPGAIDESGATTAGSDATVTGDGWHPRKHTVLGDIADFVSMAMGGKANFADQRNARSAHEAMQGFDQDPAQAIRRLQQVDGYEGKAYDMYKTYQDDKRADLAAGSLADSRAAKIMPRIGGLLNAIKNSKDPAAAYQANLQRLRNLQQRAGDDEPLPDAYDEEAINTYVGMNIDPEDQIRQEALTNWRAQQGNWKERALEQKDRRLDQFDTAEQGRASRAAGRGGSIKQRLGGRAFKDPNGSLVEFNPDGTGMKVTSKNGSVINMFKLGTDGKPVLVKTMSKAEYDAQLAAAKGK